MDEKKAGSEVIVTLSHQLTLDRQMVMQFAISKDLNKQEKNAFLDEMRELGERQMAFGQLDQFKNQLTIHLKNAELCRQRIHDIDTVAKMSYQINGGGKRGDVKYTDAQRKGLDQNQIQLEDTSKQVTALRAQIERCERLISVRE